MSSPAAGFFPGLITPVLGLLSLVVREANQTGCQVVPPEGSRMGAGLCCFAPLII